ncbi:MAG: LuxR C-terminal-related transcriptional regulator [Ktedonobacteraceae bacterium]
MPKLPTYVLHWSEENQVYELSRNGRTEECFGPESGPSWLHFLETHTSFAFQGQEGRLSIIKETRLRGSGYWYAYRTSGRRTVKRYLGSASTVTIARLEEVAGVLSRVGSGTQTTPERQETGTHSSRRPSLLLPKLQPPRLPSSLVERPRLLERLDAALERKLTLLVAPAGCGKTTVVNQWIHERQACGWSRPLAWVSLDRDDNDLFRFWRSIITACQAFQPRLGQAALAALAEALQPPFASPPLETALTLFLNDLAQLAQGGLLILDDYHTIEEPRIHELLTFFLDYVPATFGVLLMTRSEPLHLPLLRWRARGELCELHGAELRFSLAETASFVRQTFPTPLSDATLKQLDEALQGWVAGLRLLALSLPLPANRTGSELMTVQAVEHALISLDQLTEPSSPYRPLLDYFVTEILKAQPEQVQRFLLRTSVLTCLSGPLCEAVTGIENGAAQLEAIEQAGLFLEALDGTWYRFHVLFAEAMRREAALRLGEEALRVLSLRASLWYEQHALTAEAIEAALLSHDFERAALLIEQMNAEGQISELYIVRRWLERLPEEVLHAHAMLCWLAALTLQVLQEKAPLSTAVRQRAEMLLRMAEEGLDQQRQPDLPGLIAALRAMSAWRQTLFPRAIEYAQQALALLPHDKQAEPMHMWRGVCLFIVGIGCMYDGEFAEARSSFLAAHTCSLATGDRHFTRSLILLVGVCSYILGELHQAREYYQQALSDARRQEDREVIARSLLGLASIAFAWNNLSLIEQQVNEALTLAPDEDTNLRNDAALQLAELAHARGQITSAQQQIAVLLARLQMATTLEAAQKLSDVLVFSAHLSLEVGDLENAGRIVETLDLEEHLAARILRARLFLAQGRFHEAVLQLERLLLSAQEWRHALEIKILLSLAYAACREGLQARQWLQQALSQARSMGVVRLFLSEGGPLARLLRHLVPTLQEPALRAYAQTILRAFAQSIEAGDPDLASSSGLLVESLSAQEQRVLRLLAAGRSNREIAQALVVSVNTVKDHAKHLYRKLGVSNRLQAGEAARHLKLI